MTGAVCTLESFLLRNTCCFNFTKEITHEILSGGNLMIMLLLVTVISLILGMGLPTTAN